MPKPKIKLKTSLRRTKSKNGATVSFRNQENLPKSIMSLLPKLKINKIKNINLMKFLKSEVRSL